MAGILRGIWIGRSRSNDFKFHADTQQAFAETQTTSMPLFAIIIESPLFKEKHMRGAMAALGPMGFHGDLELKPYRMQFGHRETILLAMGLELYAARPPDKYQQHSVGDVLIQTSEQLDVTIEKNPKLKPIADAIRYAGHLEILRAVTAVQLDRKRYAEICTRRIHRIIEMLGSRRLLLVVVNDRILSGFACVALDNGNLRLQITHPHGVQRWEVHMGGVHGGSFERWLQAWYLDPDHPDIPPGSVSLPCDLHPPKDPTELVQGWITMA